MNKKLIRVTKRQKMESVPTCHLGVTSSLSLSLSRHMTEPRELAGISLERGDYLFYRAVFFFSEAARAAARCRGILFVRNGHSFVLNHCVVGEAVAFAFCGKTGFRA